MQFRSEKSKREGKQKRKQKVHKRVNRTNSKQT